MKPSQSTEADMSQSTTKPRQQLNHHANILNDNKGTSGTNIVNAKMHGNRGKLMNPNQHPKAPSKGRGK
jgi:hypothetical protein